MLRRTEGNNLPGVSSRRALLKSPSEKLVSPRLFLKIQREQYDDIGDRPKDFFSVRVETSENKDLASPIDSPVSSVDSDLYDPQFDAQNKVASVSEIADSGSGVEGLFSSVASSSQFPTKNKNTLVSSTQIGETEGYDTDSFSKLSNLEPDSQSGIEHFTSSSHFTSTSLTMESSHFAANTPRLKMAETLPFIPHREESSDSEMKDLSRSPSQSVTDRNHLTSVDSNHSRLKEPILDSSQNTGNGVLSAVTNVLPSDNNTSSRNGAGDSVSVITSSTSFSDRTSQNSSKFPRRNSISASSNITSSANNNGGVGDVGNSVVSSSGYDWEARPPASPQSEDSSNLSVKLDSTSVASPAKIENKDSCSSPKVERDRDRDSRESRDSRPCSPKVPPLKIIIPPKTSATSTQDPESAKVNTSKKSLPYVLNPTREQELENSLSVLPLGASSLGLLPQEISRSASPSSRPSSRGSNAASLSKDSDKGSVSAKEAKEKESKHEKEEKMIVDSSSNVDSSEQTEDIKDKETKDKDNNSAKSRDRDKDSVKDKSSTDSDDKDSKPTRTLRSHTQALQQQEKQKQGPQPVTREKDKSLGI